MPLSSPDPLELEIFRYAVEAVVDELDANITRTAHSPLVYEYKDYSVGLVTHDFRLLSQSKYNLPIFLADLGEPVRDAVDVIGVERLKPGDIFLTNYSPANGSHLNNVVCSSPIYHPDGRISGYLTIRTHWPDVGGLVPGSVSWDARSILHEGVQYRGLKIVDAGELVPEVLATIQANTWLPRLVTGDLMSNIAACTLGVTRWQEQVGKRWTFAQIEELIDAQFDASARLARAKISELPDGEYRATAEMDDSGAPGTPPLRLSVRIVIAGDRLLVDLSDLPPQVDTPINCGATGGAVSAVRVAFKALVAPERPADDGLFQPLDVTIPPGTVMSAVDNAPMGWWNQLPPTLIDLILRAIGERLPELVPAGHYGSVLLLSMKGLEADGAWWIAIAAGQGGFGATSEADGYGPLMTLMHGDNPRIADEILEGQFPLRVLSRRLRRTAGGRGLHRGGPGVEMTFEAVTPMFMRTSINRTRTPAWGLAGGESGKPGEIHLTEPGGTRWKRVGQVSHLPIEPGTRVRVRTGGGGGWGTPRERSR